MKHKFGEFFRKSREAQGLSQKQIAKVLGFSSGQYISMLECGLARPPVRKLHEMSIVYKVPLQKLVSITRTIQNSRMENTIAMTKMTKEKAQILTKKMEQFAK